MKYNDLTAGDVTFGTYRNSTSDTEVGLISQKLSASDLKTDADDIAGAPTFELVEAKNEEVKQTNILDIPVKYIRMNKTAKKRISIRGSDDFDDQIDSLFRLLYRHDASEAQRVVEELYDETSFKDMCDALLIVNPGRTYYGQNLVSDNEIYEYFVKVNSRGNAFVKKLKSWIQTLIAVQELQYFIKIEEVRKYVIIFEDSRDLFEKEAVSDLYKEELNIDAIKQYRKALTYLDGKYKGPDKLSIKTMVAEVAKQRLVVRHQLIRLKTLEDCFAYLKRAMVTRLFTLSTVASRENPSLFSGPKLDDVMLDLGLIMEILASKTLLIDTLKDTSNSITYDLKISAALNIIESVKLREKVYLDDIREMFRVHEQKDIRGLTTGAIVYIELDKESYQNVIHSTKTPGGETQVLVLDAYPNLTSKITDIGKGVSQTLRKGEICNRVLDSYLAGVPSLKGVAYFGQSVFNLGISDLELLGIILQDNTVKIVIKEAASNFDSLITKGSLPDDFLISYYPVNHFGSQVAEEVSGKLNADMVGFYRSPILRILDAISRQQFKSGNGVLKYESDPLTVGVFDDVILLDNLMIGFDPTSEAQIRIILDGKSQVVDVNLLTLLKGEATKGANITNEPHMLALNNRKICMMLQALSILEGDKRFTADIKKSVQREQEHLFQELLKELFLSSSTLRSLTVLASHEIFVKVAASDDDDYYVAKGRIARKTYNQVGACMLMYIARLLGVVDEVAIAKLVQRAVVTNGLDSNYKDYFGLAN